MNRMNLSDSNDGNYNRINQNDEKLRKRQNIKSMGGSILSNHGIIKKNKMEALNNNEYVTKNIKKNSYDENHQFSPVGPA
jgi:hypothetical protein